MDLCGEELVAALSLPTVIGRCRSILDIMQHVPSEWEASADLFICDIL
jgi:hypothetical protein